MFHWTFPIFLGFTLVILCSCDEQFLVVAPNLIRTDSQENVFLQANSVSGTIKVTITFTDFKTDAQMTEHYTILDNSNNYHTLASVQIPSSYFNREEREKKYVFMEVKFKRGSDTLHTEKRAIMVSFHAGFIFIQTNKPIYRPEESVNIRAYVSSTTFKASDVNPITIDIKNAGAVVHQVTNMRPRKGVFSTTYTLPKFATEEKYTIVARFDHWPQNNFNTTFEVKNYVLPAFNLTVKPRKPYMDVDETVLYVDITARYLFGESVIGTAYVIYGLRNGQKIKRAPKVKQLDMLEDGGTLNITMDELKQACQVQMSHDQSDCTVESLVGSYVYIKLTVLTKSGGDLVEVEKSNIKILKSPFVLALKAMPKYFKPNMPYYFKIEVSYHDGSPAVNTPLTVRVQDRSQTSISGTVSINMPNEASPQKIIITTNEHGLIADKQAKKEVTVEPYTPTNPNQPNYLYIHEIRSKVELREMHIEMTIKSERRSIIQEIIYLILSKGKIVEAKRIPVNEQQVTSVPISVTQEMIPAFRFVAFYLIGREVVSDSIKMEMSTTCVQPPVVSVPNAERIEFRPGNKLNLKIQGEPSAKISLVAVDQAVYLLSKNRFNQRHILNEVDSRDFGCTYGSGKNPMGVFSDAGLVFAMKNGPSTNSRQELKCPDNVRSRRSAVLMEDQALGQFQEKLLQRCCRDGLRGLLMPYSCQQRAQYITEGPECVKAFLKCCNIYKNKVNTQRSDDLHLGRHSGSGHSSDISNPDDNNALGVLGEGDDDDMDIYDVQLRKNFEETWLWRDVDLPSQTDSNGLATHTIDPAIPDSITQWSILYVSSSMKTGFCVAEPWTFVVMNKFFVDLKLPYSVARNEQVEIKAVVYNYLEETLVVKVVLSKTSQMCSVAFRKGHTQTVKVPPMSSKVVPYTIVPFEAKKIPIEVTAYVINRFNDRIEKNLNVVVEGVQKAEHKILQLNPAENGGKQFFQTIKPVLKGVVPRSEPTTKIKVSGNILAESIENCIHDDPLASLIRMPGGCVEQNLGAMTFPLIASLYLEQTDGWETVGVQRKVDADQYIKQGYHNQVRFRRSDDSYPPYRGRGPSTWVTAYVVKIFTVAHALYSRKNQDIINIDEICRPVGFLSRTQRIDGSFFEANPVSNYYMTGGLHGSDSAATLTAFVSIALAEVREANIDCSFLGANIEPVINKAVSYLKGQLHRQPSPRPYTTAIVSYALALLTDRNYDPTTALLAASSDGTFWPDGKSLFSLEATGYALLALVKMGKMTEANKPFAYLRDNRNIGGGSGSTQDLDELLRVLTRITVMSERKQLLIESTMVVLQALTEYSIKQRPSVQTNLNITLSIAARRNTMIFNSKTNHQFRSFNVGQDEEFNLEANGNGKGTVEVVTYYNQLPEENAKSCEMFDIEVTIQKSTENPPPGIINVFELTIIFKALGGDPAIPAILDISLPTGFTVETKDLENMLNTVEKFIDHFYFDNKLSERSSLIIHIYKVSNTFKHIVTFRLLQQFRVGYLQPSSVTIYKYYEGQRCTRLYSPPHDFAQLTTICRNRICQCMHDNCCQIKDETDVIAANERETFACNTLHHVFKVKVVNITSVYYNKYEVEITSVIKLGVENGVLQSERRFFFTDLSCRNKCVLEMNSEYLIMGPEIDQWTPDSVTNKFTYVLGKGTWVEKWPSETQCKDSTFSDKCKSLTETANYFHDTGCSL